jgi:hypothetical protein
MILPEWGIANVFDTVRKIKDTQKTYMFITLILE